MCQLSIKQNPAVITMKMRIMTMMMNVEILLQAKSVPQRVDEAPRCHERPALSDGT